MTKTSPGKCLLAAFIFAVLNTRGAAARVNFMEPHKPGVDTTLRERNDYTFSINVSQNSDSKLPNVFSMPATFTYGISPKIESGISMGMVSYASQSGISDIEFGGKYLLSKGICGEFGFSLPTADYRRGLGLGSIGAKLNWVIERQLKGFDGYASFGYNVISDNIYDPSVITFGNVLSYTVGASRRVTPTVKGYLALKGMNHAVSYRAGAPVTGTAYNEIYFAPGINYQSESLFDFNASLLVGLSSDSNDLIFFVGMDFK
jgi:hypothetical protein